MQIKTTMRYHLIRVRVAIIKKYTNNKSREGVEKREPSCIIDRNVIDIATMEDGMAIP